jgi:hypothetical protein
LPVETIRSFGGGVLNVGNVKKQAKTNAVLV